MAERAASVERAQPWLGTLVSIRVGLQAGGLDERHAHRAIESAFAEIALVHRLMSFHDSQSDLSRLNSNAADAPLEVHPYTYEVLQSAVQLSAASNGCFDITVGSELVKWNLLPSFEGSRECQHGSWEDIELLPQNRVAFRRPLCLDLGGIAKGFAVDRATDRLSALGATQTVVNAGGDLRVQGEGVEPIRLSAESDPERMAVLELSRGSVASSSGHRQRRWEGDRCYGPHVDGAHRSPAPSDRFVCVTAEHCITADALTKVVMVQGQQSQPVLQLFHASAYFHDPGQAWQQLQPEKASA